MGYGRMGRRAMGEKKAVSGENKRGYSMKSVILLILVVLLVFPVIAQATYPVQRTLTGCVVDNTFYSIYLDKDSGRAYRINLSPPVDLKPYEGRPVRVTGWLSPGDRFSIKDKTSIEMTGAACDPRSRKAINSEYALNYRLQAGAAARQGNFDEALSTIDKAFKIDNTDCDTYTDRATIYCMKNDFGAALQDMSVIKTGACTNPKKANYLLLEDLGKCLEQKGKRDEALDAYRLARNACIGRGAPQCEQRLAEQIKRLGR